MFEILEKLMQQRGVNLSTISKATGVSVSTLTDWRAGRYTPKADKRQKIAEYFGVSLEYLDTGVDPEHPGYYFDEETAKTAQELFDNPDLRMLFDAARDARPEDLQMAAEMLRRLKKTNPDITSGEY